MTVDVLSSIKGAKPSEAVNKLFDVIKNANTTKTNSNNKSKALSLHDLRDDIVVACSKTEKQIIIENFPKSKDGYLVVSKVIEE